MDVRVLTPELSVSPQIAVTDVDALKNAGFKAIICNRPDGETPDQTAFAEIEQAATAAGLSFHYIPVISGQLTRQNVDDFANALEAIDGPVLAYCRSGTRCTTLWSLSQAGKLPAEQILAAAAAAGYDMSGLLPHLQE